MRKHWGVALILTGLVLTAMMWLAAAPATNPVKTPVLGSNRSAPARTEPKPRPTTSTGTAPMLNGDDAVSQAIHEYRGPSPFWEMFWSVMAVIYFAAHGGFVLWLVWRFVRGLTRREEKESIDEHVEIPAAPTALLEDTDVFGALLRDGRPRDAIVQCWAHLEDAAAAAGVPVHAWETSSEYTERVVGAWVSDPAALNRLAALYREARFSRHDLGEEARQEASDALDALLKDLRRTWGARRATV